MGFLFIVAFAIIFVRGINTAINHNTGTTFRQRWHER